MDDFCPFSGSPPSHSNMLSFWSVSHKRQYARANLSACLPLPRREQSRLDPKPRNSQNPHAVFGFHADILFGVLSVACTCHNLRGATNSSGSVMPASYQHKRHSLTEDSPVRRTGVGNRLQSNPSERFHRLDRKSTPVKDRKERVVVAHCEKLWLRKLAVWEPGISLSPSCTVRLGLGCT